MSLTSDIFIWTCNKSKHYSHSEVRATVLVFCSYNSEVHGSAWSPFTAEVIRTMWPYAVEKVTVAHGSNIYIFRSGISHLFQSTIRGPNQCNLMCDEESMQYGLCTLKRSQYACKGLLLPLNCSVYVGGWILPLLRKTPLITRGRCHTRNNHYMLCPYLIPQRSYHVT